jgi:SAM-dependent methyltransferase
MGELYLWNLLCCPETGEDLILSVYKKDKIGRIVSGVLCNSKGRIYPIIRGIPRFVGSEYYTGSFGYEWKKWPRTQFENENIGRSMANHTSKMFYEITGFSESELSGKVIADFGCGPGRFIDIARRAGAKIIGIDMSVAVESAFSNFKADFDVLIVQADILHPPFKKEAFDAAYSIGVLHHTPDPNAGMKAITSVVKNRGIVACCVYNRGGFYSFPSVYFFRKVMNIIKPIFNTKPALGYAYLSAYLIYPLLIKLRKLGLIGKAIAFLFQKYIFPCPLLPDVKWRLLDCFDAITPRFASTHTPDEVHAWFERCGYVDIMQMKFCSTSWSGKVNRTIGKNNSGFLR